MTYKSSSLLVIFTLLFLASAFYSNAQSTVKTLFLGNSYTGVNNLPQLIYDVALSAGDTLIFDSHTPGGYQLINHSTDAISQNKIANGNWDYVVIQGQSQEPIILTNQFFNGGMALYNMIKQYNPCAVTMPYMTWGRKNGDATNCASFPVMCTYQGMDTSLRNEYLALTENINGVVSPVSVVWNYLRQHQPGIELYQPDESHPSSAGSYAAACCFYASIFKKDPSFISYDFGLNPTDASQIRNAAKTQVFDVLYKWDFKKQPFSQFKYQIGTGANEVIFIPLNQGVKQNYLWDFGDGSTSTLANPIHSYSSNGTYTVSLTTSNCDLQGWHYSYSDTVIQFCNHTPDIYTVHPWLCNYDTLWTQPADSYQWYYNGLPLPETNQYLADYAQYAISGFTVASTLNGCTELSQASTATPLWSGYYFDALGDPCSGDTVAFAVLHTSGSLSGFETIYWYRNDTLLSPMTNEDTLLITAGGVYQVKVVDTTSNCPMDTTAYSIEYDCNVVGSREEATKPFAHLYPNPATDRLIIALNTGAIGQMLKFYTIDGRLIRVMEIVSDTMETDISNLHAGIYFIQMAPHNQPAIKLIKR